MGYKYKGTVETDYPFFLEAGFALGGIKRKDSFNGREIYGYCLCPKCGKKEGALYLS